eukprot:COSAG01_NODE_7387_length_3228_cov_17.737935_4_plen_113_part_00
MRGNVGDSQSAEFRVLLPRVMIMMSPRIQSPPSLSLRAPCQANAALMEGAVDGVPTAAAQEKVAVGLSCAVRGDHGMDHANQNCLRFPYDSTDFGDSMSSVRIRTRCPLSPR